jgi:subtilisin family serine protease
MNWLSPTLRRRIVSVAPVMFSAAFLLGSTGGCAQHPASTLSPEMQVSAASEESNDLTPPSRGLEPPSKLAPALQALANAGEVSRGLPGDSDAGAPPSDAQVGSPTPGTTDNYEVAIRVSPGVDTNALQKAGANIQTRLGNLIYASVHARDLEQVADVDGVTNVSPLPASIIPAPPKHLVRTYSGGSARDLGSPSTNAASQFEHQNLDGKGVVVGIIDTGIDWRHEDFMNPDGTSRIIAFWDPYDDTWEKSNHTVGSAPPINWDDTGKPAGTVYTNDQINAAIKGQIKIQRTDRVGHGTACAGTAAGNGLGVAPKADIIAMDANPPDEDGMNSLGPTAADWISKIAAARGEPCVISCSWGGHLAAHDGSGPEEDGFNEVVGGGQKPGIVVCASAGNEGQDVMHARARFGPNREGENRNGESEPVELFATKEFNAVALLNSADDWAIAVEGDQGFLVGTDGKPAFIILSKDPRQNNDDNGLLIKPSQNMSSGDKSKISAYLQAKQIFLDKLGNSDAPVLTLPPGGYLLSVFGRSANVKNGVCDFYLPDPESYSASFGLGGDHKMVVGEPGDADDIITVGSYDFQSEWDNVDGQTTHCDQIEPGAISAYSSQGFRRDGAVKPDIAAPGQYMISAWAAKSGLAKEMGGDAFITRDGKHLAWAGTSASCPYTAGVIALMLQKNPNLTANQVKQILRDTADRDNAITGLVPNEQWGYGKLDPAAALAKVEPGPPLTPTPAPTPPQAPPATEPSPIVTPAAGETLAGTYSGDGMTIVLVDNGGGSFVGSLARGNRTFVLAAHMIAGRLEGKVSNLDGEFPFTATIDGDQLQLQANGKTFNLARQNSARGLGGVDNAASADNGSGSSRDLGDGGPNSPMQQVEIDDPMIGNLPAYTFSVPQGWKFEGSVHWNQDPFTLVSPVALAHAPGGIPGVFIYPQGSYVAGIREQRVQMYAPLGPQATYYWEQALAEGNLYLGKEIRYSCSPADYIKRFVIPLYRNDLANAQVVSVSDAPKVADIYFKLLGGQCRVTAAKVEFAYQLNGNAVTEDVFCAIAAMPTIPGITCWSANVFSFAAPTGAMGQAMPLMAAFIKSGRPQLRWLNEVLQVSAMMQQNQRDQINAQGALSNYIARTSDEISDENRQEYERQCQIEEQLADEWDAIIRGDDGPNQ